jgi:hypothetical protein
MSRHLAGISSLQAGEDVKSRGVLPLQTPDVISKVAEYVQRKTGQRGRV